MAVFEFKLPDIGEGIVEGEIVKWLVKEGDEVAEDQPLVEVMTDKATVVIPSPRKGRVTRLHGAEGQMAKVHSVLVTLELAGDGVAPAAARPVASVSAEIPSAPALLPAAEAAGKVLATPVTRRIARERGINLATVEGSGPNGRVLKADVLKLADGQQAAPSAARVAIVHAPVVPGEGDQRIPLKGVRRAIARKMVESKFTAPHYTFVEEMDATELKALRARLNERLGKETPSAKLSFLPFIAKAVVAALRKFPQLNANFDEAAQELVVRAKVNLGIAVASDEGLVVPVVKDAGAKTLRELSTEIAALAEAARTRKVRPEDIAGGTFTITSLGEQGGLFATPILNHPEVAILGVHRMRQRPVVREGRIEVREMMNLSLSFDHRVIDGAVGAKFTYEVIKYLEAPDLLMLDLR
ncbi:MAG TPA: dihydrolipoamide acetyltransferase family protein [Myxococcales bacterium]|jgi:pyruvate dehydrogenase E2 component (dihydrolipoamide acetyltransferase)